MSAAAGPVLEHDRIAQEIFIELQSLDSEAQKDTCEQFLETKVRQHAILHWEIEAYWKFFEQNFERDVIILNFESVLFCYD